jgi:DNA-binding GntR family transcriptional regulator
MDPPMTWSIPEIPRPDDQTTQEYAYSRLRHAIMTGTLTPGTALTVRGLVTKLGLSQTPIREAIRRLSSERAIEVLGNRRLKIPEMTAGRFEELVSLRIVLEVHAAERALPYVSDVKIKELEDMDGRMDESFADGDLELLTLQNQEFHRFLYRLNPDQAVVPLIESIWLQLGPFQRQIIRNVENYYVVDRHKQMLSALRNRDMVALAKAVEGDIRDGSVRLGRQMLRRTNSGFDAA